MLCPSFAMSHGYWVVLCYQIQALTDCIVCSMNMESPLEKKLPLALSYSSYVLMMCMKSQLSIGHI